MKLRLWATAARAHFRTAWARYPAPLLFAWFGMAAAMMAVRLDQDLNGLPLQLTLGALAAVPVALAVALPACPAAAAPRRRAGSALAGGLVLLGVTTWLHSRPGDELPGTEVLRMFTLILGAHLLVAVVILHAAGDDDDAGWVGNVRLFLRYLLGALYAVVLYVGLVLAVLSGDRLLSLDIPAKTYLYLWLLVTGGFHPLFFLTGLTLAPAAGTERPAALRRFVVTLLVPLTALYLLILYAYALRIAFLWELPNGWVGLPVLTLAVVGLLAVLLLQPWAKADTEPALARLVRGFFLLTLPLTGLLALSIGRRVSDYGVTEPRYYVVLLTLWLAVTCVVGAWRTRLSLRWIPGSLTVLVLLASVGPWGAAAWSLRSQQERTARHLQAGGLLDAEGRLQAYDAARARAQFDAASLRSNWRYLHTFHGPAAFSAWMPEPAANPANLLDRLGVPMDQATPDQPWRAHATPAYLPVEQGPARVHHVQLHRPGAIFRYEGWQLRLTAVGLVVVSPDADEMLATVTALQRQALTHHWLTHHGPVSLQVLQANGQHRDGEPELLNAQVLLALPAPGSAADTP
jgi:hypothetical protein